MARQTNKTIPSDFVKLDTNVTDPDEFVNVRDLQVARANHNILLARGMRRTLMATRGQTGTRWIVRGGNIGDDRLGAQRPIFEFDVLIDEVVQSVTCVIEGEVDRSGTGLQCRFTGILDRPFGLRLLDSGIQATATEGGATKITLAGIPAPFGGNRFGGKQLARFSLYMQPEIGSNLASGIAITSVANNGGRINFPDASTPAGITEGRAVHFSNTAIPPRVISSESVSGPTRSIFFEKPFAPQPIAGTDTMSIDEVAIFQMDSVTLYEDHLTAFDASRAGI
jgi:hypothetical protein